MNIRLLYALLLAALSWQCTPSAPPSEKAERPIPELTYGELFHEVAVQRIYADGKTLADAVPRESPEVILAEYRRQKDQEGFDLQTFVENHFELPPAIASGFKSDPDRTAVEHIEFLWDILTRQPTPSDSGTLIPLPYPYVVPGGRFREIYYWDSYFTLLGLQASERYDLIEHMVDNFAYLIDTIGFIPNGNRTYFLSRSQPPFFAAMVNLLAESVDDPTPVYRDYLPAMEDEYAFWMEGENDLAGRQKAASRHVVALPDGSLLNRYWDARSGPRTEMYADDLLTAGESEQSDSSLFKNLRSACESGWDFSSRWMEDGQSLTTIQTTEIIPVDLNALLFLLETTLAHAYDLGGQSGRARELDDRADRRQAALAKYCWDPGSRFFRDYHWQEERFTQVLSAAGMFPFFVGMAEEEKAPLAAQTLRDSLLRPGGVVTTQRHTGQQWDAPNGWAPLQWVSIQGLRNYGQAALASEIKNRWVKLNLRVYQNTGKMVEKYNVEDLSLEAGGGEYPVQDGFGWTNGVLMTLLTED